MLLAAEEGHERVVELLLQFGANPYYKTPDGSTAYLLACRKNHERLMVFLKPFHLPNIMQGPELTKNLVKEQIEAPLSIETILNELNLTKYSSHFQDMKMETFKNLKEEDLKGLGISLIGPRRKISSAIAKMNL